MRKENIPFIFKYLLKWVPGLNINLDTSDQGSDGEDNEPVIVYKDMEVDEVVTQ